MILSDVIFVFKWALYLFLIGVIFLPFSFALFPNFKDKGYIFSKILGIGLISYFIFIVGLLKIIPFGEFSIYLSLIIFSAVNIFIFLKIKKSFLINVKKIFKFIVLEEILFITGIFFWAFVRGHSPDINGLEKFMDFGILNSVLKSKFFPPSDIWFASLPTNYYYFGHLITAVLTKLTQIPSFISYNLMLSTLFSFTLTASLSLGINFFLKIESTVKPILAGVLTAFIVTFGGNLTTVYAFFMPYAPADKPIPFWQLLFKPFTFPNDFWYPNATRFIPFTIHEFPIYSFVVSDLHGHVLDIPFVLLIIALLFSLFIQKNIKLYHLIFIAFLLSVMYMTNAWDGLIYLLLTVFVILLINLPKITLKEFFNYFYLKRVIKNVFLLLAGFFVFVLPFSINFKPFVSGIGVLCAPDFLTNFGKLGPFIFEIDHCQKSPLWQLMMLYGGFYFFAFLFILFLKFAKKYKITPSDYFVLILILLSTILLLIPEFFYIKDIYPQHYRANTMFKLAYQAFIMLSLSAGYIIIKIIFNLKNVILKLFFTIFSSILLFLILVYPVFAIGSFYNNLTTYKSLNGTKYLQLTRPLDLAIITWINNNIKNQPVILEASGDSYTDYARISANTGLITVIGWSVHEWLWRGTYDIVAPRIEDVKTLYEATDINLTKKLLRKYRISYVVISSLEIEKYPKLNQNKFKLLGEVVYSSRGTFIYKITP